MQTRNSPRAAAARGAQPHGLALVLHQVDHPELRDLVQQLVEHVGRCRRELPSLIARISKWGQRCAARAAIVSRLLTPSL